MSLDARAGQQGSRRGLGARQTLSVLLAMIVLALTGVLTGPSAFASLLPTLGIGVPALNDLVALGQGTGQSPATAPVQEPAEPVLAASPRAVCGPGSNPLAGMQGRVPAAALNAPAAAKGYSCNLTEIAHQGDTGGFKTLRYIDTQGHECAFYDTTLLSPLNALRLTGPSHGVAVLDMTDPAHPVQTDTLTELPMMSPHESLSLNPRRGLLAAVLGNPATYPGLVSIYDAHQDCRHPVHDSTELLAKFGHEGNFSADGNTFYAAGTGANTLTAIDTTDPTHPHVLSQINEYSHGLTLSDNGNRAYVADPITGQLLILDTSQIQARKPNPQVSEISRLTWRTSTIPQNAIPITIHGHPYILEFDEYAFRFNGATPPDTVGAARIIDIADEHHPRVVSNIRLEVNQPAGHHEAVAAGDPGTIDPAQGYAAHYCGVPREVDPEIVACSFISSGLRVFNIQDPLHPREIAYYVAPPHKVPENGYDGSNFAMSKPTFAPERREIWYTDGSSGFYVLRLATNLWPNPVGQGSSSAYGAVGCPAPSGRLSATRLGPVWLGEQRSVERSRAGRGHFTVRHVQSYDIICLTGSGIRAGYPSPGLLRKLTRAQRRRFSNRMVLALTANRAYALGRIRPGTRTSTIARTLRGRPRYRVGTNTWYLLPGRGTVGVLKVQRGRVGEVGVADARLLRSRAAQWRFFTSFR